jgi:glycosyltransferase involved in cell wall biosynthesis
VSKSISILIPTYNEAAVLPQLFERLEKLAGDCPKYQWQFWFVNDGSRDKSLELIKKRATTNAQIHYIDLSRNYGKEIAMIAGIDNIKTDALVIIDADLQDPPELIPEMIKIWEDGYDDVYARRKSRARVNCFN